MPSISTFLLLLVWVLVAWNGLVWVGRGLLSTEGTVHLVVAVAWCVLAVRAGPHWRKHPRRSVPAALLAFGVPVLHGLSDVRLASVEAAAMLLSATGVVGLFTSAATWRRLLPLALLAVGVLPVTQHLDVVLGLPLRRLTASMVAVGFGSLAAETVLEVEGGYAHVDLPCAGVQSLWSAGVVLAAATFAWRRRVDVGWVAIATATAVLLVLGNTVRVGVLVALHHTADLPLAAEIVHTPLGLLTFAGALAPALFVLHRRPPAPEVEGPEGSDLSPPAILLGLAALVFTFLLPAATPTVRTSPVPLLPDGWIDLATTEQERRFVGSRGGILRKGTTTIDGHHASVALISSHDWVVQHVPELCLTAGGWSLADDHPTRIGSRSARIASVHREGERGTAIWWYQDATRSTDDLTERIAAGWIDDRPWVLVSLLVDGSVRPDDPDLAALTDDLAATTAAALLESP